MSLSQIRRITPLLVVFSLFVLFFDGCGRRPAPKEILPAPPPSPPVPYLAFSQPPESREIHAPSGDWATVPIEVVWSGELRPGSLVVSVTGPQGSPLPETTVKITSALALDTSGAEHRARGSISLRGFAEESRTGTLYSITAVADLRQPARSEFATFTAIRKLRVYRAPSPPGDAACLPGSLDPRCR